MQEEERSQSLSSERSTNLPECLRITTTEMTNTLHPLMADESLDCASCEAVTDPHSDPEFDVRANQSYSNRSRST